MTTSAAVCYYEILGIDLDADDATIKKAHRRKALQYHPDKNLDDPSAAEHFKRVQQAYECLRDPVERKWYDEHREAILKGWSATSDADIDMVFDVVPFTYAGCYEGYSDDDERGFYAVYRNVFFKVAEQEKQDHLVDFGTADSPWEDVAAFYQRWESFTTAMSFAWADPYNIQDADNRQIRRAMEDENKKARRVAKKARNDDIQALIRFVKRRDPRVKERKRQVDEEKARKQKEQHQLDKRKKAETKKAREEWREQAEKEMAETEEKDRIAGRIRLADLEDDYDYGGGKKKKGKNKKKNKNRFIEEDVSENGDDQAVETLDDSAKDQLPSGAVDEETDEPQEQPVQAPVEEEEQEDGDEPSSSSSEEKPDVWRCEACRKDFKSEGQMENHMKSKKHKQALKKYEAMMEQAILEEMLEDMEVNEE